VQKSLHCVIPPPLPPPLYVIIITIPDLHVGGPPLYVFIITMSGFTRGRTEFIVELRPQLAYGVNPACVG